MINMRHLYSIGAWNTRLDTAGHKEEILSREERELKEALGDNIPNDSKHQQISLASFFTLKGVGSRFSRPVSKKKKRGRIETETSSGKSMEVAEVAVDASAAVDATEL